MKILIPVTSIESEENIMVQGLHNAKYFNKKIMKFRDLEKARVIIKTATGLDVSYAFDDLAFPDHTAFIIQFDDKNSNNFFCYFHDDCISGEKDKIFENLVNAGKIQRCSVTSKGTFYFEQKDGQVDIHFI